MSATRKLQVFVSSTYLDLKAERQAAVEAILQAGHIPAGMELFAAGDVSQWESIKRWIDDCDALMLLLGERYGSIEPESGKSYIHLEYEYALSTRKRVFALVLGDAWVARKYKELGRDASDEHRSKHKVFKEEVLSKMSGPVEDEKDIKLGVAASLREIERDDTLSGWVKATDYASSQALVTELRKSLEDVRSRPVGSTPSLTDIGNEIARSMKDLAEISINRITFAAFDDDVDPAHHRLRANGLAIISAIRHNLTGVNPLFRPDAKGPWVSLFWEEFYPLFEIWGYGHIVANRFTLTSKGRLFMKAVNALNEAEVKVARFERMNPLD